MSSRYVLPRARTTAAPATADRRRAAARRRARPPARERAGSRPEPMPSRGRTGQPPPAQQASISVLPPISQVGAVPDRSSRAETVISATFRPARAGRPVVLTRWHHRRWQVVERTTLTRTGRAEFSARTRAAAQPVRYRVTAPGAPAPRQGQHRPRPLRRLGRPGLPRRVQRRRPRLALGPPDPVPTTPGAAAAAPRARPTRRPSRPARSGSARWPTRDRHRSPATPTTSTATRSAPPVPLPDQRPRLDAELRRLPLRRRRRADEVPARPRLARVVLAPAARAAEATARPRGAPRSTSSSGSAPTTAAAG